MQLTKSQTTNLRRILNIVSSGVAGVPFIELTEAGYIVFHPSVLTSEITSELNEYGYEIIETVKFDGDMISVIAIQL